MSENLEVYCKPSHETCTYVAFQGRVNTSLLSKPQFCAITEHLCIFFSQLSEIPSSLGADFRDQTVLDPHKCCAAFSVLRF